ncbi:hypothetical protein SCB71_08250 [Herbiconiux sp. KACC 21604]|uniref:hypothetical protein n=1 Tax=unclassified Herbiconiux TaxID=2618217 RepID=UPI001491FE07|nr:hypothetical protein [Herbiconiux sp. SALV-R1]QJU53258.1 hypothetical protein HL652_06215 [Herbiconiux sp. SALV-R1]WPO88216.1 hypothetical protein SCB71_08250 [Herbiconiux sp. KACC 21604]
MPADRPHAQPVALYLSGRTLRGSLGEAFRRDALARFAQSYGDSDARAHVALARTVELTAVAVTRTGPVRLEVGVADPAFRSFLDPEAARRPTAVGGEQTFTVDVDALPGLRPLSGPPGVDTSRHAVVRVESAERLELRVTVIPPD